MSKIEWLLAFGTFFLLSNAFSQTMARPIGEPSLLITVKTTAANHASRVRDALDTWAADGEHKTRVLFVSDAPVDLLPSSTATTASECPAGHTNAALCCKMGAELSAALQMAGLDFWCHFDDDSYPLLANLRAVLRRHPSNADLYLGRPSISAPITVASPIGAEPFWFGTGGAGICLSASTLQKLSAFVGGHRFERMCERLGMPDDVTLGFILENLLSVKLVEADRLHSHLDRLDAIPRSQLAQQLSLSGSQKDANLVDVPEEFAPGMDPLRFRALHKFIRKRRRRENKTR